MIRKFHEKQCKTIKTVSIILHMINSSIRYITVYIYIYYSKASDKIHSIISIIVALSYRHGRHGGKYKGQVPHRGAVTGAADATSGAMEAIQRKSFEPRT